MGPLSKALNIVYAEDSKSISKVVKSKLTSENYNVIHFENGEGVVDAVKEFNPIAVLLDYEMPVKDGITVLSELRQLPETQNVPVIMFTTKHDQDTVVKCLQLGVSDYIIKDALAIPEIISRIKKYVK